MNRNDDFDRTLEAWLRRQAPPQAPDRVLDAALERLAVESQRRSWLHRSLGGTAMNPMIRTAAVAAVVAVAALIGLQFANLSDNVGTTPSPVPSLTPTPSDPTTPDVSASPVPSSDASASLVVRLFGGGEAGRFHLVTILDDGRVISSDPFGASPPVERRLTAAGVELVRDELAATGLTDTSADYQPVPNPGVTPPPYGGAGPSLEVGQIGGETVTITWFLFGDTEEDYFQPQPEAEALEALAARLTTLGEWLPADAWDDASGTPYTPSQYRLTIASQQWGGGPDALPVESDTVLWPLADGMDAFGEVINPPPDEVRCGLVDGEDGRAVVAALEEAGATLGGPTGSSYELGERSTSRLVTITLEPILPFGEEAC
jgi:hypothetical protein